MVFWGVLAVLALPLAAAEKAVERETKTAVCPVCDHYRDMECLVVEVDDAVYQVEYKEKTYYFCSGRCRKDFLRKPWKFLKAEKEKKGG
jgi:YHS domain-containing protein